MSVLHGKATIGYYSLANKISKTEVNQPKKLIFRPVNYISTRWIKENYALIKFHFKLKCNEFRNRLIETLFTPMFPFYTPEYFRSSHLSCSIKNVFLKISKIPKKHCCSPFFNKIAGLRPAALLKKRIQHSYFPVNFAKFSRTLFYRTHLRDYF